MRTILEWPRKILDRLPLGRLRPRAPVVAVLRLDGVIGRLGPLRKGLSLATLAGPIEAAFKQRNLVAVALAVNSPGGSPVQSALIQGRIRALADEGDIPVYAFAEDVAASGGYWLACAGDEIYADASSILGSIGVVSSGFGFTGLIEKMGVERRLHTAGDNKARLDPFRAEKPADIKHLKSIHGDIHAAFKEMVRARRGERLTATDKAVFNGDFWAGGKALEMGLIDGLGDMRTILREKFGDTVKLRLIGVERGWLKRKFGLSEQGRAPERVAGALIAAVEERWHWGRFGL